jgi:hypothetical protein
MSKQNSIVRSFFPCVVFVCMTTSLLFSQPKKGLYGITTTISKGFIASNNMSTNTGSLNLGFTYLPSNRINLRGELGFWSQKDTAQTTNSEFTFTSNVWYYLNTNENVSTFLGGALGFGSATDGAGKSSSLLHLNGFFGVEYWISTHFSCFGHIGLVYASYKVAERPATNIFTSATSGLTWYF